MAFDFKKEYKAYYLPAVKPEIIEISPVNFLGISGKGDPNEEGGSYQIALGRLYTIAYTLKMSYKRKYDIEGFFQYLMPPLEGFWWMPAMEGIDYSRKKDMRWISVIRVPDFIQKSDFDWAIADATRRKKDDFSKILFFTHHEGLCVQCLHKGAYDDEPVTISKMEAYAVENGYITDICSNRLHHEIYLKDPRKCIPEKLKTVIRHPVKKRTFE